MREKTAGRHLRNNGYIRAIIRDHFGVSEAQRQESNDLARRRLNQFHREVPEIESLKKLGTEALHRGDLQGLSEVIVRLRAATENFSDLGKRRARSVVEILEAGQQSLQKGLSQG